MHEFKNATLSEWSRARSTLSKTNALPALKLARFIITNNGCTTLALRKSVKSAGHISAVHNANHILYPAGLYLTCEPPKDSTDSHSDLWRWFCVALPHCEVVAA